MIDATALLHMIGSIVESLTDEADSIAAKREALIEFAGSHELSVQDTATLFRVAAGEGVFSPVYRLVVDQ